MSEELYDLYEESTYAGHFAQMENIDFSILSGIEEHPAVVLPALIFHSVHPGLEQRSFASYLLSKIDHELIIQHVLKLIELNVLDISVLSFSFLERIAIFDDLSDDPIALLANISQNSKTPEEIRHQSILSISQAALNRLSRPIVFLKEAAKNSSQQDVSESLIDTEKLRLDSLDTAPSDPILALLNVASSINTVESKISAIKGVGDIVGYATEDTKKIAAETLESLAIANPQLKSQIVITLGKLEGTFFFPDDYFSPNGLPPFGSPFPAPTPLPKICICDPPPGYELIDLGGMVNTLGCILSKNC